MRRYTFPLLLFSFSVLFFILMFTISLYSVIVYNSRTLAISAALLVSSIFALFVSVGLFLCKKQEVWGRDDG